MDKEMLLHAGVLLLGTFIASISQVMLKKSALKAYPSKIREYLNPLVICAYFLFFLTTVMSIYAYKKIPLSMGPILESTSYFYVFIFGATIFKEKVSLKKIISLLIIFLGIFVYSFWG